MNHNDGSVGWASRSATSQRHLSDPFVRWRSYVQEGSLWLPGTRIVVSVWLTEQAFGGRHRDDVDDCRTRLMSGSGQAGSLSPSEMAHASVMGALCAAIAIIAVVVPHAGGLGLLGTVPMGLLSYRYRIRVLITATVAAGGIAFLIAGFGGLMTVVHSAYIGGLTGVVKRRRRGTRTVIVASFVAGAVFNVVIVAAL